jgi:hypothetical protein
VGLLGLTVLPKLQTSRLLFWGDLWVFELFVGVLGVTVLPQLSELEIAVLGSLGLLSCLSVFLGLSVLANLSVLGFLSFVVGTSGLTILAKLQIRVF